MKTVSQEEAREVLYDKIEAMLSGVLCGECKIDGRDCAACGWFNRSRNNLVKAIIEVGKGVSAEYQD